MQVNVVRDSQLAAQILQMAPFFAFPKKYQSDITIFSQARNCSD
jgi:HD-like signal output (HDOD) protein